MDMFYIHARMRKRRLQGEKTEKTGKTTVRRGGHANGGHSGAGKNGNYENERFTRMHKSPKYE